MPSARKVRRKDPVSGRTVATGRWQAIAEVPEALVGRIGKKQDSFVVEETGRVGQRAAKRWATAREDEFRAMLTRTDPDDLYIQDWYERVRDSLPHTGRTPGEVARLVRVFYVPKWGGIPVQEWDPADVRSWLGRLQTGPRADDRLPEARRHPKGCRDCKKPKERAAHIETLDDVYPIISASRARTVLAHLKALLNRAVEDGLLERSPLERVKPPKTPRAADDDVRVMPESQFLASVQRLPDWCRDFIYSLPYTGLRLGEANALSDEAFDADARVLTVACTVIEDDSCRMSWKLFPKSGNRRQVPVPAHVAAVWSRRVQRATLVLPVERARGRTVRVETWYRTPEGQPLCRHRVDAAWKKAQRDAGVDNPYRVHDLRHLYASMLIAAGRSLREVAELMGHSHTRVTELYSHLTDGWQEGARQALERPVPPVAVREQTPDSGVE